MKKLFLAVTLNAIAAFWLSGMAVAQLAPAGDALIQGAPGQYYLFMGEGSFTNGASFVYLNYVTGDFDTVLPSVNPDGSFSGVSLANGRVLTGQITSTSISITYNGASVSGAKLSSYGPTRPFAGRWVGILFDPTAGLGIGEAIINSQGQVFALASQGFDFDVGVGVIDGSGNFSVPLLSGRNVTGVFNPVFARFDGSLFFLLG